MTRSPRLLDSSSNDALRSLLASGLDDAPGADALPKVAGALGLAVTTVATSSLAASAGAQAAVAEGTALAGSAPAAIAGQAVAKAGAAGFWGGSSALALGKTLLVSMVSAGTLSVGAVAVHEYTSAPVNSAAVERAREAPPGAAPRRRTPQPAAPGVPAAAPAASLADPQAVSPPPNPTLVRPNRKRAPHPESAHEAQSTDRTSQRTGVLAREVRQIDSARQALESRNADSALAALEAYERSRVVGVLDREALLLKIEALTQKQDLEQAKALARQYVERFPTDTHAPRLRALMSSTSSSVRAFPDE